MGSIRRTIVYRIVTDEYSNTEEFKKKLENNSIQKEEIIGSYEQKRVAEETVKKLEEQDELQRTYERTDLIRYRYEIHESIYDTGVFYVNIPINKIPSNFYLVKNEELYNIINRVKPYGTKPIINTLVATILLMFICIIKLVTDIFALITPLRA